MRHKRERRVASSYERIVVSLSQQGHIGHRKRRLFIEPVRRAVVLDPHDCDTPQRCYRCKKWSGVHVVVGRPEHDQRLLLPSGQMDSEHAIEHWVERLQNERRTGSEYRAHAKAPI
jgi:hypothetical protein